MMQRSVQISNTEIPLDGHFIYPINGMNQIQPEYEISSASE